MKGAVYRYKKPHLAKATLSIEEVINEEAFCFLLQWERQAGKNRAVSSGCVDCLIRVIIDPDLDTDASSTQPIHNEKVPRVFNFAGRTEFALDVNINLGDTQPELKQ